MSSKNYNHLKYEIGEENVVISVNGKIIAVTNREKHQTVGTFENKISNLEIRLLYDTPECQTRWVKDGFEVILIVSGTLDDGDNYSRPFWGPISIYKRGILKKVSNIRYSETIYQG